MKLPMRLVFLFAAVAAVSGFAADAKAPRKFATVNLGNPRGIAVDAAGNLYVGDVDATALRRITPAGVVTLVPIAPAATAFGVAVDRTGALFISDADRNAVYRIAAGGGATAVVPPSGAEFGGPTSLAVDAQGNIFVGENSNGIVRKVGASRAAVFAGTSGETGTKDGKGPDARLGQPRGLAIDPAGNLYVADEANSNIRKITPDGVVTTLAGATGTSGSADGKGAEARFGAPRGLAADARGNVYVADTDNHTIRKITPAGEVTTLAGRAGEMGKVDGPGKVARFSGPRAVAVDADGYVYVADSDNSAIRQVAPDGTVTTVAAATAP